MFSNVNVTEHALRQRQHQKLFIEDVRRSVNVGSLYGKWLGSEIELLFTGNLGMMDGLGFYMLFNSISVILGQWKGEHEGLCAMKCRLGPKNLTCSEIQTRDLVI